MSSAYFRKLRDPLWQRRRLEVLNAANFTCRDCLSKDRTLHVHHAYYEKGRDPWDYPDDALICLCEECHEERQAWQNAILMELAKLEIQDIQRVYGCAIALADWALGDPGKRASAVVAAGAAICEGYGAAEAMVN